LVSPQPGAAGLVTAGADRSLDLGRLGARPVGLLDLLGLLGLLDLLGCSAARPG
jgi:hypothetical protein